MVKRISLLATILLLLAVPTASADDSPPSGPAEQGGVWYVLDCGGEVQYAESGGTGGNLQVGMALALKGTQIATADSYVRLFNEQMGSLQIEADSRVELGEKVIIFRGVAHMNSATGRSFQFGIPEVAPVSDMRGGAAVIERDVSMFCLHPSSSVNTLSEEAAAMFESVDDYACWQMSDGLWEPVTPPEAVRKAQHRFARQALAQIAIDFERLPPMREEASQEKSSGANIIGTGAGAGGEGSSSGAKSMCLDSASASGAAGDIAQGGNDLSIERGKTRVNVKVNLEE